MISKRIENPPLNLWWSQIDTLIYMSIKCPWLNPNGLGPHYKPHVVLIIIIICIGSRVRQVLHRASLILPVYIFGIGLTKWTALHVRQKPGWSLVLVCYSFESVLITVWRPTHKPNLGGSEKMQGQAYVQPRLFTSVCHSKPFACLYRMYFTSFL